jgi:hypothetical protein
MRTPGGLIMIPPPGTFAVHDCSGCADLEGLHHIRHGAESEHVSRLSQAVFFGALHSRRQIMPRLNSF